ncbi:MAG: tetratricopeptide repeat protein [Phormidium sp. BM_Day4_Bin.17]|nr:tetratricopeptide repeat protein [Phormidium sp. BM_Day4_Bin.17]UCJ11002.1 MAG: tetratricopeptide repeat protein [Phormidium sp. PBR-2020]
MDFPQSRQPFYQEIKKTPIDLGKAALCIALEEYPDLDIDAYLQRLDGYAEDIAQQLPQERYPLRVINALNSYLFETLKFRGNQENYYDPKNSFLNDVLERRVGIPITLSVVYLELAKRLQFPMVGVGMPGHFIIRPDFEDAGIFVDAFNGGEVLFPEDCERRLTQIYGRPISLQPEFLEPVSSEQILVRMLTNLKAIYIAQQEISKALAAIERILLLAPDAVLELRDRGLIYYQSGQAIAASQDLERYLSLRPDAPDASTIQRILGRLEQ